MRRESMMGGEQLQAARHHPLVIDSSREHAGTLYCRHITWGWLIPLWSLFLKSPLAWGAVAMTMPPPSSTPFPFSTLLFL